MKKYNIVYADPAWSFGDKLRSSKKLENGNMHFRELELHYNTMKTSEICSYHMLPSYHALLTF